MSRLETMARFEEPRDPKKIGICIDCNESLYEGEALYRWERELRCENCMDELLQQIKKESLWEEFT